MEKRNPVVTVSFPTPVPLPMTEMPARDASVPPAMNRNSATGAAHVKIFPVRKNTAMLTKGLITTKTESRHDGGILF